MQHPVVSDDVHPADVVGAVHGDVDVAAAETAVVRITFEDGPHGHATKPKVQHDPGAGGAIAGPVVEGVPDGLPGQLAGVHRRQAGLPVLAPIGV